MEVSLLCFFFALLHIINNNIIHILTPCYIDNLFVASTYKRILEHISKRALDGADLHMEKPIVKIEAPIRRNDQDPPITLTTAAGEKRNVDEVVVTCPLGWLKRNKSAFAPPFPPHLAKAIDSISYGRLEKVYVTFPEAFWSANGSSSSSSANKTMTTSSVQFMEPTYVSRPKEDGLFWNQECLSLASLPNDCAHPTLLFYTTGPCSSHIVDKIANCNSPAEYYDVLDDFFRPFYSRLRGYSPSTCKPIAFLATQWQKDPYAGNGSYSNFQVGLEQGDKDIETLRTAMGVDRGVWFAGEHTAPFVALGTTTGAYWSGERAAGQICDVYRLGRSGIGVGRDDSLPSAVGRNGVTN